MHVLEFVITLYRESVVKRASASAGEELERLPSLEQGLRDESLCQMGEVRKEWGKNISGGEAA